MGHVTFMPNLCQNLWIFTNSVQDSGFTKVIHKTRTEQSKHNTSLLLYKLGLIFM